MRRRLAELVRTLGLMPLIFRMRMWLSPISPSVLVRNLRYWTAGDREPLPLPTFRERFLVAGSADIQGFLELGRAAVECIEDVVERNGGGIEAGAAILDFGCGCGRVLRHWRHLEGVEVHGTEMNPSLVAAAQRCVPFAKAQCNDPDPPLEYPANSFDLVYALSVFTHLHEDLQKGWRDELSRILKPGGLLIITTHGEHYLPRLAEAEQAAFRAGQSVVHGAEYLGENLCVTYHPEAYVRELMETSFDMVQFVPEGALGNPSQDLYLLRAR